MNEVLSDKHFSVRDAKKLLALLILIECFFVAVYGISSLLDKPVGVLHTLFDLDGEGNIPAVFSSIQLLVIGLLLLKFSRRTASLEIPSVWILAVCGVGFVFLALDEALVIHEKIRFLLQDYAWIPRFKGGYGIWIPLYLAIGFLVVLPMWRGFRTLGKQFHYEARRVLWGSALLIFGAVCMEIIKYQFLVGTSLPYIRGVEIITEELLEMVGASLILYGVIRIGLRLRE